MEIVTFKQKSYPAFQAQGFAAQFAFPFAQKLCIGKNGLDIGYCKPEWKFPGAVGLDDGRFYVESDQKEITAQVSATDFPYTAQADYIFSSHCLEHLRDWVAVLDYWKYKLRPGGILFLYLPHCDFQEYWQPFHNRKHCNWLRPDMLKSYFESSPDWKNIFVTGHDLNYSFYAVAEKI